MRNAAELRQKRAGIVAQMRATLDGAEAEARDLTAEEEASLARMDEDCLRIIREVEAIERQERVERSLGEPTGEPTRQDPSAGSTRERSPRATEEYRSAFWSAMRSRFLSPEEVRVLQVADDTKGGYLVPEATELEIIKALDDATIFRTLADVRTSATLVKMPVRTSKPTAKWIAESGTYDKSEMAYGRKFLDAHKCGTIIPISEELLADASVNMEAEIRADAAIAIAELAEEAYINGTGVGQPTGFLADADLGVTAASATAATFDELLELKYSLKQGYRKRASWMMKDSSCLVLAKIKNNDGQYIWQPSVQAGQPERLLNAPVNTSEFMPAMAAGLKAIAFGDFSFYRIQDRSGISIQALVELYAEDGEVGFRVNMRTDGLLRLGEAVKVLKMK